MDLLLEQILTYGSVLLFAGIVVFIYIRLQIKKSKKTQEKIERAKQEGLYEPVSLHPVVNEHNCIKTEACIAACPEKDILGIVNGKATPINASQCVGHGACFHACPTEAITLCIGTEARGVDLPHVNMLFETNVKGISIAGELGGMGLIKNAVEQGKQAVDNIAKYFKSGHGADYDLIIVGAGPAGISASLAAKKHGLNFLTLEQDSLGGTVYTYPRAKLVMTSPMDLPLYGKVKLRETNKPELLALWEKVLSENNIEINTGSKVESITKRDDVFTVETNKGDSFTSSKVLLAIGRRGSPRKLQVPGELSEKVAYRLIESESIQNKKVLVVGGGDSAVESALLLADQNQVSLSYRKETFGRIKPGNRENLDNAINKGKLEVLYNTNVKGIEVETVTLTGQNDSEFNIENDLVYIFAGGELPTEFLKKCGLEIARKYGEAILKHN